MQTGGTGRKLRNTLIKGLQGLAKAAEEEENQGLEIGDDYCRRIRRDEMNTDYEIRKLDQKMGEAEDRNPKLSRCPTCECLLIIARGSSGVLRSQVFKYPTCPNCGYEKR